MKCGCCDEIFADDEDGIASYQLHYKACHTDEKIDEEKIFEDFRKNMIKQKNEYDLLKKKTGDSDLIFNAKDSDAHHDHRS